MPVRFIKKPGAPAGLITIRIENSLYFLDDGPDHLYFDATDRDAEILGYFHPYALRQGDAGVVPAPPVIEPTFVVDGVLNKRKVDGSFEPVTAGGAVLPRVAGQSYGVGTAFTQDGRDYLVLQAHVANATFAVDLAASGRLRLLAPQPEASPTVSGVGRKGVAGGFADFDATARNSGSRSIAAAATDAYASMANATLLYSGADAVQQSVYWPCVWDEREINPAVDPATRWRMLYSTDHDGTSGGGVWQMAAPDPLGPFTHRKVLDWSAGTKAEAKLTLNTGIGTGGLGVEIETPRYLWLPELPPDVGPHFLTVQEKFSPQATAIFTSTDRITWTYRGKLIAPTGFPGITSGHTGYMKLTRYGQVLIGQSLLAGGSNGLGCKWVVRASEAHLPAAWHMDQRVGRRNRSKLIAGDNVGLAAGGPSCMFLHAGELWGLGTAAGVIVSGTGQTNTTIVVGRVQPEKLDFVAQPSALFTSQQASPAWKQGNVVGDIFLATDKDSGRHYAYWTMASGPSKDDPNARGVYICGGEVRFAKEAFAA